MERTQENIVSSFFYYMWNHWGSREECRSVFGPDSAHFWSKWCALFRIDSHGAAERFYAELSPSSRKLLVERACKIYNGSAKAAAEISETNHNDGQDMMTKIR